MDHMSLPPNLRAPKRGDIVVDEIKRWIAEHRFVPGDKLPKEAQLQALFGISKGTAREALKSLDRAFQLMQNYLFFRRLEVTDIYAARRLLEPELAAGAVAYLTEADFAALEHSIETCAPASDSPTQARAQRQEDLHFHDVLAAANPNGLLRFMCELINQLLRHQVAMGHTPTHPAYQRLGAANVAAHTRLLIAARRRDADKVHVLMTEHIDEAGRLVADVDAAMRQSFVSDADLQARIIPPEKR
jgi:GntR family transcriptional repressor for pyruvate dehydrogenase complex